MSMKVMMAPQRYVQGPGALLKIAEHIDIFSIRNPLIIASPSALRACRDTLENCFKEANIDCEFVEFNRECTFEEIDRIKTLCLDGGHDAIIGCGGGKVMDAGRAAAAGKARKRHHGSSEEVDPFGAGVPCIQVPTVASSDAPTASVSVIYNDDGVHEGVVATRVNPHLVLIDTEIIAQAPVRTLVAGMGDALATYFEADTSARSGLGTNTGGHPPETILAMARLSYDLLIESGLAAKHEVEAKRPGPALEKVVEANILLSGVGYECGGLAAAHAIGNNLMILHEHYARTPYHGELVAFSLLTQLLMEGKEQELMDKVRGFCKDVGLPTTFEEMGLTAVTEDMLLAVAEAAARNGSISTMPNAYKAPDSDGRFYDPQVIVDCMRKADALAHKNE